MTLIGRLSAAHKMRFRRTARALRHDNPRPIIHGVTRRIHLSRLSVGEIALDAAQAHHVRDVLRLPDGVTVEVFDDSGAVGSATLLHRGEREAAVRIETASPAPAHIFRWTVASAVPKGERADWMVEKLSELGTDAFIPLAAARSIVLPEGKNKLERWKRISSESARQSRRIGVMRIEPLMELGDAVERLHKPGTAWFLSTAPNATPLRQAMDQVDGALPLSLFIGPEGGWADEELSLFERRAIVPVQLTSTVLRLETAAVTAAAMVACLMGT